MKKELFDGALVVKDGDALANTLSELPYLVVKRKDWKKADTHQWRVMVKLERNWLNRFMHYLCMDRIAFVDVHGREERESDWVSCGGGWSPLSDVKLFPSFDAIREYVGVLEAHVDLDFDYEAKRERELKEMGIIIFSILAFTPFLYPMVQILPPSETIPSLAMFAETLPLCAGWTVFGMAVSLLVWYNLRVLVGLEEGKWWIFTSYIRRRMKSQWK